MVSLFIIDWPCVLITGSPTHQQHHINIIISILSPLPPRHLWEGGFLSGSGEGSPLIVVTVIVRRNVRSAVKTIIFSFLASSVLNCYAVSMQNGALIHDSSSRSTLRMKPWFHFS